MHESGYSFLLFGILVKWVCFILIFGANPVDEVQSSQRAQQADCARDSVHHGRRSARHHQTQHHLRHQLRLEARPKHHLLEAVDGNEHEDEEP